MNLSIIATCDMSNGTTRNGEVPWIKTHEAIHDWLKHLTESETLIMTEDMYSLFGEYVCPDARVVIVITDAQPGEHGNVIFTNTVEKALEIAERSSTRNTYVLANNGLYRHMLLKNTHIDTIHMAVVQKLYNCDQYFPYSAFTGEWRTWWKEEISQEVEADAHNEHVVRFVTYLRRNDALR